MPLIIGKPLWLIRPFKKIIKGKKIENNIRKKLNADQRILDDSFIGKLF
jgi:hypothetical protein